MVAVKVLVVDDHALFRRGITAVLASQENLRVVGEATDGLEAIDKAGELAPDVILMDLHMPQCTGLEATQAIRTKMPQVNILVLTVSENEADLFAAVKFGAKGYILKNIEPEELTQAIFHIAQGGVIISPLMAAKLLSEFQDLSAGVAKKLAQEVFISENTVKTHLRNIMDKLHLVNRSQAAAYAVKRGLVQDRE